MWQLDQLKYTLGLGGLVSFYGIVSVGVWLLGERFGAGNTEKIVIIAIVLLTLPFALIIGYFATRKRKKKEKSEESAEAEAAPAPQKASSPGANYDDFSQSAEEATQYLKSSGMDVYSLPWFLVAGGPKSGKTSLILSSGLSFQALASQRQAEFASISPTRSLDWRITSDAVFLDTAGRYQTDGFDADEWAGLIETLKKYRPQRPIDGLIITVNAERILTSEDAEIEQIAKVLRTRLDEVIGKVKLRFPVYLVFTHADAMEGFTDSFSVSQKDGENLIWGATIPIEKSEKSHALFDEEFDNLSSSLLKRRLIRLSAPFSPNRQLRIFNFPLHFSAARRKLGHFVSTMFRPNPFSDAPFLRGFYFTAALRGKNQGIGQSYFAKKFVGDVLLRDKDLVKTYISQRQKPPIMGWILTALGAMAVSALLLISGISLYKNRELVNDAASKGEDVLTIYKADQGRDLFKKTPDEIRTELTAIDELRQSLVTLDDYERSRPPFWMRFGLYSGNRLFKEKLLNIYFNAIEQRFKKPMIARLEADLQKFSAGSGNEPEEVLDKNFDYLASYLMLSDGQTKKGEKYRKYAQGDFLAKSLAEFWKSESKLPGGYELMAQQNLDFYSKQIDRDEFPRIPLKLNLVDSSRKKLQAFPAYLRYYKREVNKISKEVEQSVGAATVASILTNNGGSSDFLEGNYQVPSAYTVEGYKLMKKSIREADQKLSEDDWVMDEEAKKDLAQTTDASNVETRYFKDYADHWKAFVKGINIKKYDKSDAARALQSFSDANSPLDILLREIYRQTKLSAKPKPRNWIETAKDWVGMLEQLETRDNTKPEQEFRPLFSFTGSDDKAENAPIAAYRKEIGSIFKKLNGIDQDSYNELAKEIAADNDKKLGLRNSETAIASLINGFAETPSGQEIADLLRKPLGNLRSLLGADAQSQLGKTWETEVLPKAREAERGFPFDGPGEADLAKLTAYLNPVNGTLSDFYTKRLEKYFEKDAGGRLKMKDAAEVKFTDEFIKYLNDAFELRDALFKKEKDANFEYDLRLNPAKGAAEGIIEITIDGEKITSGESDSKKFKFPASTNSDTGVFMNFSSTTEPLTTSGKQPANSNISANAGNSNVNTNSNSNSAPVSKFQSTPAPAAPLRRPGTWGLFMFFADGGPKKNPAGGYDLSYKIGSRVITATIKPIGGDLFDRNMFRRVKAPEKLLK